MLDIVYMVVAIVGGLGGPAVAVWIIRRLKRADQADIADAIATGIKPVSDHLASMDGRLARVEAQFGPNGGGLREAVNNMSADVGVVKETTRGMTQRFEDHLRQADDDRRRIAALEQTNLLHRL